MKFLPTELPEVILVEPDVYRDDRGFFLETYQTRRYRDGGIPDVFVQDNHSRSTRGALRGLHAQFPRAQGKLVRAVEGEIFDVAVDARKGSPRYGKWVGATLSDENFNQLWVPPGFLHGFCVLSDVAQVEYKCTEFYHGEDDLSVAWNDPEIAIAWPIADPMLSKKDGKAPSLGDVQDRLVPYRT